jgi:putative FmdB family regulatory protein
MPIFEYECKKCNHTFEFLLLPSHPTEPECPSCHSRKLEKVISIFGLSTPSTRKANAKKSIAAQKAGHKDQAIEEHREYHKHHDEH